MRLARVPHARGVHAVLTDQQILAAFEHALDLLAFVWRSTSTVDHVLFIALMLIGPLVAVRVGDALERRLVR